MNTFYSYIIYLFLVPDFALGMLSEGSKNDLDKIDQGFKRAIYADDPMNKMNPKLIKFSANKEKTSIPCRQYDRYSKYGASKNKARYCVKLKDKDKDKDKEIILPALKFPEDSCLWRDTLFYEHTLILDQNLLGKEDIKEMNLAKELISMYYVPIFVNKKGEYKICGQRMDVLKFTLYISNISLGEPYFFSLYDKIYKSNLCRNNHDITDDLQRNIDNNFQTAKRLFGYILNDKYRHFYFAWRKVIFYDVNKIIFSSDKINNTSSLQLGIIGVESFLQEMEIATQLLSFERINNIKCKINNARTQGYELNPITFFDEKTWELKNMSVEEIFQKLNQNRENFNIINNIKGLFNNIHDLFQSFIIDASNALKQDRSFSDTKEEFRSSNEEIGSEEFESLEKKISARVSRLSKAEIGTLILNYYYEKFAPNFLRTITTSKCFADRDSILSYMNIVKTIEDALSEDAAYK